MFENLSQQLASWVVGNISQSGYLAVFFLMTLESALVPIPSEVTMPFAGFLVGLGKLNFFLVVLVGALGNLTGSLLAYAVGYWGQEPLVHKIVKKIGKYLLISLEEVETSERWFRRHGGKIAFFSRLLPVVRTFISLPAGVAKMNFWAFILLTFVGSFLWSGFLTWLGVILGQNWSSLEIYFRKFQYIIIAAGVTLVALYVYLKIKKVRQAS